MTVTSFVGVQAFSTCCRIQLCMIHGGVQAPFSVLEASEVKLPALEGFVLLTDIHVSRGTWLGIIWEWATSHKQKIQTFQSNTVSDLEWMQSKILKDGTFLVPFLFPQKLGINLPSILQGQFLGSHQSDHPCISAKLAHRDLTVSRYFLVYFQLEDGS